VISPSLGEPGETADLTIYRIIQEALTNVFRHADATRIDVTIEPADLPSATTRGRRGSVRVCVRDNGSGLLRDHKVGIGLFGMRERVMALGGTVSVESGDGGVTVEAVVPCDERLGSNVAPVGEHDPAQRSSA
jgi:two-component system sensor histidine kinase UhpB